MNQTAFDDIVAEIGRDLVAQMAPEELILYPAKCEVYFKDRPTGKKNSRQKDEMLGLGTTEVVAFLTPVILSALTHVVKVIADEIAKQLGVDAGDLLRSAIRKLFKRSAPAGAGSPEISGLTREQLARAHAAAVAAVLRWQQSPEQARQIADAIVANLAVASGAESLGGALPS
jgi:hypothetical protein